MLPSWGPRITVRLLVALLVREIHPRAGLILTVVAYWRTQEVVLKGTHQQSRFRHLPVQQSKKHACFCRLPIMKAVRGIAVRRVDGDKPWGVKNLRQA